MRRVKRIYEGHVNENFCSFSSFLCQEPYTEGDVSKSKVRVSASQNTSSLKQLPHERVES